MRSSVIFARVVRTLVLESLVGKSRALERALAGEELDAEDGMEIFSLENLHMVGAVADEVRRRSVGDDVTFAASYYMNYTNVCAASCQMCAFYRKAGDDDAYTLSAEQITARVSAARGMGATEVHIVGGFHPKLPLEYYEEMLRSIKKSQPAMHIKAFTAAEIFYLSALTRVSVREILSRLKDAGLDTLPGGGAEILHPDVRKRVVRGKCSGQEWLDTVEEAHRQGIRSNVTMLYGHVERPEHIVDHLLRVRELQKRTRGFITFIPLKFSLENTELVRDGDVTAECSSIYDLRVMAASRLLLAGALDNISVYWVAYGKKLAQVALSNGGNDLVGTAFSEEIYRAAGKSTGSSVDELGALVREIGRTPVQRDTMFGTVRRL